MKAVVGRKALADALKIVSPAVARGSSLAVLSGVHMAASRGLVTLTCSDLETTISTTVEADCDDGVWIVPAATFARVAVGIGGDRVTLAYDDDLLRVEAGSAVAQLRCLPVDEWPRLGSVDAEPVHFDEVEVDLIRRVASAASIDRKRPFLTGVRFCGDEVMATDSYRLHLATVRTGLDMPDVNVPADVLRRVIDHASSGIDLAFADRHVEMTADGTTWATQLIHGDYPNVHGLFRADPPHRLTLGADRFIEAIERASSLGTDAPDGGVSVFCAIASDRLTASTSRGDVGSVSDDLTCESTWIGTLAVNAKFMTELIEAHGGGDVTLEFVDHMRPLQARADSLRLLLMPKNLPGVGEGK